MTIIYWLHIQFIIIIVNSNLHLFFLVSTSSLPFCPIFFLTVVKLHTLLLSQQVFLHKVMNIKHQGKYEIYFILFIFIYVRSWHTCVELHKEWWKVTASKKGLLKKKQLEHFVLKLIVMDYKCPSLKSVCQTDSIRGRGLWELIRSWGWSTKERD